MKITLYKNLSDNKDAIKDITIIKEANGTMKEDCSILDPVIIMKNFSELFTANYLFIEDFNRYYFINDITVLNNGYSSISCHHDILSNAMPYLQKLDAVIARQEFIYNPDLNDASIPVLQNEKTQYKRFPGEFNSFTLTVPMLAN